MHRYAFGVAAIAATLLLSRVPATAGDYGSHDTGTFERQTSGAMENTEPGTATMNPTDEAPAMVPGSASPGTDMKSGEIEATGKPSSETDVLDTTKPGTGADEIEAAGKTGVHGGARDAAGSYDANDTLQNHGDAEANADLTNGSSFDSALQQKNLNEAMDPKNGRSGKTGGSANGAANATQNATGSNDMPD